MLSGQRCLWPLQSYWANVIWNSSSGRFTDLFWLAPASASAHIGACVHKLTNKDINFKCDFCMPDIYDCPLAFTCTHTHAHTLICTYSLTHTHIHTHSLAYTHNACMHTYHTLKCTCLHTHAHTCTYLCAHSHMHTYSCTYLHTHMHILICTHSCMHMRAHTHTCTCTCSLTQRYSLTCFPSWKSGACLAGSF